MTTEELTPAEIQLIREIDSQITVLQNQRLGALRMAVSSRGLAGAWDYVDGALVQDSSSKELAAVEPHPLTVAAIKLLEEDDFVEARNTALRAIAAGDSSSAPRMVIATSLGFEGSHAAAIDVVNKCLADFPDESDNLTHERAFHNLLLGNWQQGWEDWERRNTRLGDKGLRKNIGAVLPNLPEWTGEPLKDKRILVVGEGGIGDGIMYARYLPILQGMGADVSFCCKVLALADFIGDLGCATHSAGGDAVLNSDDLDYWVGLYSLPLKHGVASGTWEPIKPVKVPGISWEPKKHSHLRIGISWDGDTKAPARRWRPSNLDLWDPIFVNGVEFVSLQLGEVPKQCSSGLDPLGSLMDAARIISGLDLVICGDGMVAHLSGSVGVPTWLLLHEVSFWPWAPTGGATAWYPSIKILRRGGDWSSLFEQVGLDLGLLKDLSRNNKKVNIRKKK